MNRVPIFLFAVLCFAALSLTTQRTLVAQEDSPKAHDAAQQPEEPKAKQEQPEKESPKSEKQENAKPEKNDQAHPKESKPMEKGQAAPRENGNQPAVAQTGHAQPTGKGGHIPDDKFRASFGRSHSFKVSRPVVVNNQTTIQYSGYSFILADPWPATWAYTDDCYIDYIDGEYFLFDLLHPGVRIALFVQM